MIAQAVLTKILLTAHVLVAIIAVGPVTVAASMFPAAARRVRERPGDDTAVAVLRTLHRICRVYATIGVLVPVLGLATASSLGVLGDTWLIISIGLTATAAAVLVLLVLPRQDAILAGTGSTPTQTARLAMLTGVFNVLWATVTVLMIVRPGSSTGGLRMLTARQLLGIGARVEFASLMVLLVNLATVHWPAVSSLVGPVHGCAYLLVVLIAVRDSAATGRTKLTALVPGVGGLLVLRALGRRTVRHEHGRDAAGR